MQDAEANTGKTQQDNAKMDTQVLQAWFTQRPTQTAEQTDEQYRATLDAWLDQAPSPPTQPPAPKRTRRGAKGATSAVAPAGAAASSAVPALCG